MIDLSITIVAYNNYNDIIKLVDTLQRYTHCSIKKQVFIIDNSGYDDKCSKSRELLKKRLCLFNDVEYTDAKVNLGFGKGNNYVINELNSKYHAIVNPDIIFQEDVFSSIIAYMEESDVDMCIPKIVDEEGDIQKIYRRELTVWDMFIRMFFKNGFKGRKRYHTMQDMDYTKPFNVPFGQGSFLVIKTKLYKSLNGFDDRYFMYLEDADLCKRVNDISSLMYYPDAKVIHKWEKGSHKNKVLFKYHLSSMIKYFNKWGWKFV